MHLLGGMPDPFVDEPLVHAGRRAARDEAVAENVSAADHLPLAAPRGPLQVVAARSQAAQSRNRCRFLCIAARSAPDRSEPDLPTAPDPLIRRPARRGPTRRPTPRRPPAVRTGPVRRSGPAVGVHPPDGSGGPLRPARFPSHATHPRRRCPHGPDPSFCSDRPIAISTARNRIMTPRMAQCERVAPFLLRESRALCLQSEVSPVRSSFSNQSAKVRFFQ